MSAAAAAAAAVLLIRLETAVVASGYAPVATGQYFYANRVTIASCFSLVNSAQECRASHECIFRGESEGAAI